MAFGFANQDTIRLTVGDGEWLDVRQRLGTAQAERLRSAALSGVADAFQKDQHDNNVFQLDKGIMKIDVGAQRMALVEAYLVGWSSDRVVSRRSIEALLPPDFERIHTAIEAHHAARDEEKKA